MPRSFIALVLVALLVTTSGCPTRGVAYGGLAAGTAVAGVGGFMMATSSGNAGTERSYQGITLAIGGGVIVLTALISLAVLAAQKPAPKQP